MSELGILELETEHAELLPEREALGGVYYYYGGHNYVHVYQWAYAVAYNYNSPGSIAAAAATNYSFVG